MTLVENNVLQKPNANEKAHLHSVFGVADTHLLQKLTLSFIKSARSFNFKQK